ncbi:MAG: DUF975 family protein [Clostridia bacterium]|nr:DUF975 family protein [Clostridia bacterium]
MTRQTIKQNAKEALRFQYWPIIGVELIAAALTGSASLGFSFRFSNRESMETMLNNPHFRAVLATLFAVSIAASIAGILYMILFGNVITVGNAGVRLKAYRKESFRIVDLFSGLKSYKKNIGTMALYTLFITLGFMCFFVPGIIVALGLYEVPYMLAEDPNISGMGAIRRSWENMKGHKGELFVLHLSFIGWILLTILTFGVLAIFYAGPYMSLAEAGFYRGMHPAQIEEPAPEA